MTRYERGVYAKHYVPWTFLFVRTEHTEAYRELFVATQHFAKLFYGVELKVAFGGLDHAAFISTAFTQVWPDIKLMTCWAHVARKVGEKSGFLVTPKYYENVVGFHIQLLYASRTQEQFLALADLVVAHWRNDGENRYADWFCKVYLAAPWDSWFMGAAGNVRGILPSQNALESFHKVIKTVCIADKNLPTAAVLNNSLPGVLTVAGANEIGANLISHFCEGPLITAHVEHAYNLLHDTSNYVKLRRVVGDIQRTTRNAPTIAAVAFNAPDYALCPNNKSKGVKLTDGRVKRYLDSLSGILMDKPVTDAKLLYQSVHLVKVHDCTHEPFALRAKWRVQDIEVVRRCYQCDCVDSRQSGWICAHIVATLAMIGKVGMQELTSALPVRKRPGGQLKQRGALARARYNNSDTRFFSATHLETMFVNSPASPLRWRVAKEFTVRIGRGQTTQEHYSGTVESWMENAGRYQWRVRYSHGPVEVEDVESLAALVGASFSLGVHIIP